MELPFSKAQMKNVMIMYAFIIALMIGFYVANRMLADPKEAIDRKTFETNATLVEPDDRADDQKAQPSKGDTRFKVLDKVY